MVRESVIGAVGLKMDRSSDVFGTVFPHLSPEAMRRQLPDRQILERAVLHVHSLARSVARSFNTDEPDLVEAMVERFTDRVFAGSALDRFDPDRGDLSSYLLGVMRNVFRECFRERLRKKLQQRLDETQIDHWQVGPAAIAELNDEIERVRGWVAELPRAQRAAVARRFSPLADLDLGGDFHEQAALHRGMNALRKRAREAQGS
jgi:DNA-directed RNA polymerase specialized sigma24 family protein